MTAARARKPVDAYRRQLLGKVHIAKKDLGLDDDTYRDVLRREFGKDSAARLSNAQLVDLVEHFKTLGFKPKAKVRAGAECPQARKVRALWIAGWHLGVVRDRGERALQAFVRRQSGIDAVRWLRDPAAGAKVIEGLKAWLARPVDKGGAGVDWGPYASTDGPFEKTRCRVMEAQWRILHRLGAVRIGDPGALSAWVEKFTASPCKIHHTHLDDDDADRVIAALGAKIRKAKEAARS